MSDQPLVDIVPLSDQEVRELLEKHNVPILLPIPEEDASRIMEEKDGRTFEKMDCDCKLVIETTGRPYWAAFCSKCGRWEGNVFRSEFLPKADDQTTFDAAVIFSPPTYEGKPAGSTQLVLGPSSSEQ